MPNTLRCLLLCNCFIITTAAAQDARVPSLSGRVISQEGVRASVAVDLLESTRNFHQYSVEIRTDEMGNYQFDRLPEGRYSVHAYDPLGRVASSPFQIVEIEESKTANAIHLELTPAAELKILLCRADGAPVTGQLYIQDASAGYRTSRKPPPLSWKWNLKESRGITIQGLAESKVQQVTFVSEDGNYYESWELAPRPRSVGNDRGAKILVVRGAESPPAYGPIWEQFIQLCIQNPREPRGAKMILESSAPPHPTEINRALQSGRTWTGHELVRQEWAGGIEVSGIVTLDGATLRDARIHYCPFEWPSPETGDRTHADGRFKMNYRPHTGGFAGILAGLWSLKIDSAQIPVEPHITWNLDLYSYSVEGTLRDSDGDPVQGRVYLYFHDPILDRFGELNSGFVISERTDSRGNFKINKVLASDYYIAAVPDEPSLAAVRTELKHVDVRAGLRPRKPAPFALVAPPAHEISIVTQFKGGSPAGDAVGGRLLIIPEVPAKLRAASSYFISTPRGIRVQGIREGIVQLYFHPDDPLKGAVYLRLRVPEDTKNGVVIPVELAAEPPGSRRHSMDYDFTDPDWAPIIDHRGFNRVGEK